MASIAPNGLMIKWNDELEMMREAATGSFHVLSWHTSGGTEKDYEASVQSGPVNVSDNI
jgi:hypothetical protein